MNKDVLLSLNGLQFNDEGEDGVEIITSAEYFNRNGKHFVMYEEVSAEYEGVTKNTIKIKNDSVEISKKGPNSVHMHFEENKKNETFYDTPYGRFMIGLLANKIEVKDTKDNIHVKIAYSLEINNEHISDCVIQLDIKSKKIKEDKAQDYTN